MELYSESTWGRRRAKEGEGGEGIGGGGGGGGGRRRGKKKKERREAVT